MIFASARVRFRLGERSRESFVPVPLLRARCAVSCQLRRRKEEVRHLQYGRERIDCAKVNHGIYFHGDVIICDHILAGNLQRFDTQRDPPMRSTETKTNIIPGPFALRGTLPNRKMTPRSYSRNILIDSAMSVRQLDDRQFDVRNGPPRGCRCEILSFQLTFTTRIRPVGQSLSRHSRFKLCSSCYLHGCPCRH